MHFWVFYTVIWVNKIWVDQGSEFYSNVFKKRLKDNNIEIYSTHNEGKSVVAERFIRTLKNKIYKHMTVMSKNVYFHALDRIVDKYKNTYHRTIKMKPIDIKNDSFTQYDEEIVKKIPNLKLVIISEFQSIRIFLLKCMLLIGVKKFLLQKK